MKDGWKCAEKLQTIFHHMDNDRDISIQTRQLFARVGLVKFRSRETVPSNSACIKHS